MAVLVEVEACYEVLRREEWPCLLEKVEMILLDK